MSGGQPPRGHSFIGMHTKEDKAMTIDRTYEILVVSTNEVHVFTTSLSEREFYNSLDAVYGQDGYKTLAIR